MPELRVVATIPAKPGSEDAIREALSTLVEATAQEEGCVSYELFESQSTAGVFVTIETWRGQEDLDAHLQTEHVAAAFAAAGEHLAGEVSIHPLRPVAT